ncbi:hypothetical protein [Streptomyces sp. G45]|uniref:hypothetical protein n=1 Tax=Streptomyces sp. G45 TaxID=3406627 RepID=UPI003C23377C
MNRTRSTAAVLATAGAITAAQLGLAGAASAASPSPRPSAQSVAPQSTPKAAPRSTGCPIDIVYTSRFYVNSNGWVTNGGLYFGIKNKSNKSFKKVSFTVTNVKNVRFGSAKAKGKGDGVKITRKTSKTVRVYDPFLAKKASLGVKVNSRLLNTRSYKVKFEVRGQGWNCAVNQGTWGA